jgi:hypothetical protein
MSGSPFVARWRRAVIRSVLSDAHVRVALAISDHVNGVGDGCRVSVQTLAEETRKDRRTVQRALRELESAGWIEATSSRKGGRMVGDRGRSTTYRVALPDDSKGGTSDALQGRQRSHPGASEIAGKSGTSTARGREEVEREVDPPQTPQGGQYLERADAPEDRLAALDVDPRPFTAEELEEVRGS